MIKTYYLVPHSALDGSRALTMRIQFGKKDDGHTWAWIDNDWTRSSISSSVFGHQLDMGKYFKQMQSVIGENLIDFYKAIL